MWLVHLTRSNKEITIYLYHLPFLVEQFEQYLLKEFYFSLLRTSQFYGLLAPESTEEELEVTQRQLAVIIQEQEPLDEDSLLHFPIYAPFEDNPEPIVISRECYLDAFNRYYPKKAKRLLNKARK